MKRLTKRERAQVVELLRCAADLATRTARPIAHAAMYLGYEDGSLAFMRAINARCAVAVAVPVQDGVYREQILEAALRVELGEWP